MARIASTMKTETAVVCFSLFMLALCIIAGLILPHLPLGG